MGNADAYFSRKLMDGRFRMLAVIPKRKLKTIPSNIVFPFYTEGTGDKQANSPLTPNDNNDFGLCATVDPRNF